MDGSLKGNVGSRGGFCFVLIGDLITYVGADENNQVE